MAYVPRKYEAWPKWAMDQVHETQKQPQWCESFPWPEPGTPDPANYEAHRDRTAAIDGQRAQGAFPFDMVVLAKFICEAKGDDRRLFMNYLTEAGEIIEKEEAANVAG